MFLGRDAIKQAIISGEMVIKPFTDDLLKDASYTFTLSENIRIPHLVPLLSPDTKPAFDSIDMGDEGFVLYPNTFVLGETRERLSLKGKIGCLLSTRGSCAQLGLNALLSSTFAEPDTDAQMVIEIHNASANPILLSPGMKIVKGIFSRIE